MTRRERTSPATVTPISKGEGEKVESKGFLDKVLQFMGIHEEPTEDDKQDEPETSIKNGVHTSPDPFVDVTKKRPRLVSLPGQAKSSGGMKVSVVYPKSYEDVQPIADHLKNRQPVILSLGGVEAPLSRRIIDFMSGVTYALEGHIHRIGDGIFLIAPSNVVIDAETSLDWQEEESLSP